LRCSGVHSEKYIGKEMSAACHISWFPGNISFISPVTYPDILKIFPFIPQSHILLCWRYFLQFPGILAACDRFLTLHWLPKNSTMENSWWPWKQEKFV
jgi:hypothetical protein